MESIIEAVGQTPMVRLHAIERDVPGVELYLKLEYMNPGGSVKDRPARQMLLDAIESGRFTKDKTLIDATSGNTGVAYSLFGAALGYKIALVMPANVSKPRKDITQAFGTTLIHSDPMEGSDGAIRLVRKLVAENPDKYFYSDQYSNPSNPGAHYLGTGVEILEAGGRPHHALRGRARHQRHGHGHHTPAARAPPQDCVRGGRAQRGAARARGPQAHGQQHRARHLRPHAAGRDPAL